jgi:hypothetical protein
VLPARGIPKDAGGIQLVGVATLQQALAELGLA